MVAETQLTPADLIAPLFVREGIDEPQPIASWVDTHGVWTGFDVPANATVRDQCEFYGLPGEFQSDAGAAVSYFHDNDVLGGTGELKSVLTDGVWGTPEPCTAMELAGENYTLVAGMGALNVAREPQRRIERAIPPLERPRCEGY